MAANVHCPFEISENTLHAEVTQISGWALYNAHGNNASVVELRNGAADGVLLAKFAVPSKGSSVESLVGHIDCPGGLYVKEDAGTLSGVVWRG